MKSTNPSQTILKILLKDIAIKPTITSLAKEISMSRVGVWKLLKKLQSDNLIVLSSLGAGKTSTYLVSLNWDNSILEKMLSLALTEDAVRNRRWQSNFSELEKKADFLIIYGSVLHSPKDANDIDILGIVSNKNNFKEMDKIISKLQKTQLKKIHSLNFTQEEFSKELKKPNKSLIDAVKKGIILFGQEEFIRFMGDLSKK